MEVMLKRVSVISAYSLFIKSLHELCIVYRF